MLSKLTSRCGTLGGCITLVCLPLAIHAQGIFQNGFENETGPADFVVTWTDDQDVTSSLDVRARGFENGFPGTAVSVSDLSAGTQFHPAIAVAPDGRFVVAWDDDTDGNGLYQIHARGFYPDGSDWLARFTVNSVAAGQQHNPAVAIAPNGDFVVVWEDDQDGNGLANLRGRGFYANGAQKFSDRNVANSGPGAERNPAIDMADDGSFVVAWADDTNYNDLFQIHARGFYANGMQNFAPIVVNETGAGQQLQPDVAVAPGGDFVVVFADDADMNWFYEVRARGFHATGVQKFGEFTVNEVSTASQYWPAIGMADDGRFAAVWIDQGLRITSRLFDASGTPLTGDIVVNDSTLDFQIRPDIDVAADGGYVVVWEYLLGNGRFGLKGRRLGAEGERGPELSISNISTGDQMKPVVGVR